MPTPPMTHEAQATYEKALEEIGFCRASEMTTLDLAHLGLTQVPPEIGQLTALTILDLSDNQLTSLPP